MIPLDDPTALSLLFHLNSEPWLNEAAYQSGGEATPPPGGVGVETIVPLSPVTTTPLDDLLRARHSSRSFTPVSMSLDEVSSVLHATYGIVGVERSGAGPALHRRSVPSAGALYPLDLYVFLRRIDGLDAGLYRYDADAACLLMVREGDLFASLRPVLYAYPFVEGANAVVVMVATFARTQAKYGPRGYRYILLEAGHAGQNACLRAAELGLSSLCMGGFVDSGLNELLGLNPRRRGAVYTIGIGRAPAGERSEDVAVDQRGR